MCLTVIGQTALGSGISGFNQVDFSAQKLSVRHSDCCLLATRSCSHSFVLFSAQPGPAWSRRELDDETVVFPVTRATTSVSLHNTHSKDYEPRQPGETMIIKNANLALKVIILLFLLYTGMSVVGFLRCLHLTTRNTNFVTQEPLRHQIFFQIFVVVDSNFSIFHSLYQTLSFGIHTFTQILPALHVFTIACWAVTSHRPLLHTPIKVCDRERTQLWTCLKMLPWCFPHATCPSVPQETVQTVMPFPRPVCGGGWRRA